MNDQKTRKAALERAGFRRHAPPARQFLEDPGVRELCIVEHMTRTFGAPLVEVDEEFQGFPFKTHVIPPRKAFRYWVLFTTGMSLTRQALPSEHQFCELAMLLTRDWPMQVDHTAHAQFSDDDYQGWAMPLRWLEMESKNVVLGDSFMPGTATMMKRPIAEGTGLTGWWRMPMLTPDDSVLEPCPCRNGDKVRLLHMIALHAVEGAFLEKHGAARLLEMFFAAGATLALDLGRKPVIRS